MFAISLGHVTIENGKACRQGDNSMQSNVTGSCYCRATFCAKRKFLREWYNDCHEFILPAFLCSAVVFSNIFSTTNPRTRQQQWFGYANRVHRVLEKSLKVLEFWKKFQSLENTSKVLEFECSVLKFLRIKILKKGFL